MVVHFRLPISFLALAFSLSSACFPSVVITCPSKLPDGVMSYFYTFQLVAEGAVGEVTWSVDTGENRYVEVETSHHFAGTDKAVQIMGRGGWDERVELPFLFPYYGEPCRRMHVSPNGHMGPHYANRRSSPHEDLMQSGSVIAPLWHGWSGGSLEAVYAEASPWRFVVTWKGTINGPVNSQGVLYPTGDIEFNYGEGNRDFYWGIGISGGVEAYKVVSVKSSATDLDRAPSSRFMLSALPPGLELDPETGIIFGTPLEFGLFGFRLWATDSGSPESPVSKTFSIAVPGLFIHSRLGGVFVRKGEPNPISWGGAGIGDRITVRLYRESELLKTILDNAPNEEGLMWQPTDAFPLSDDYTITVQDNADPPLGDSSRLTLWDGTVPVPQCCWTIQEGVDFARDGDTVLVAPGTYPENVVVKKKITIAGAGGGETVLDAASNGTPLTVIGADGFTLRDATIAHGEGEVFGGIYCTDSTVSIERCSIHGISATFGGGIFLDSCSATIRESRIEGNTAEKNGGGIYAWQSRLLVDRCVITGNAAEEGGGIFCWYSAPRIARTVIAANTAAVGGGMVCDESFPLIMNCTVADNSATEGETGGIHCVKESPLSSIPWIMNSIVWRNGGAVSGASAVSVAFSDTDDATYAGTNGNLHEHPLFANPEQGDYALAGDSPCIDAGSPDPAYNDEDGTRCDMGAFGGTGRLPDYAVVTHIVKEPPSHVLIYWLAGSLKDFVLQLTTVLTQPWSEVKPLDVREPWRDEGALSSEKTRFYRIETAP